MSLGDLINLFEKTKKEERSIEDHVNLREIGNAIQSGYYHGPLKRLESIPDPPLDESIKKAVADVTGKLAYSSDGLESICCNEFRDRFEKCRSYNGGTVYSFTFKGIEQTERFTHECPFCHEPLRRIPRRKNGE